MVASDRFNLDPVVSSAQLVVWGLGFGCARPVAMVTTMADDPERDLLPVKEGAAYDRQKIPPFLPDGDKSVTHALYITKLDRKDLEDRYMGLMLDNINLKKLCNKQEEKIKKLATKLLRLAAEQKRYIPSVVQRHDHNLENMIVEQQQQILELQRSNSQLQDRLIVLRNQLVEHTSVHSAVHCNFLGKSHSPVRSPTRSHSRMCASSSRAQHSASSQGSQSMFQSSPQVNTECRSRDIPQHLQKEITTVQENYNVESTSFAVANNSATVAQELSQEILRLREQIGILEQDLETQREQNNVRIAELEDELAQDQQQKVAENVELIRLQRSLQQQSALLAAETSKNQLQEREVTYLRCELESLQRDNDELQRQLVNEHNKVAELQQDLQNVKSEHLLIKELEEQIRDVQNERTILKEHNEHLLALTSSKQNQNLEQEVALHSQIAQMENLLEKEQRERAQLVQQIEELKAVTHEQSHLQNSVSQEEALRAQVVDLQSKLAETLSEKTQILLNLEETKTQVNELKSAHDSLVIKLKDLQAQYTEAESQLLALQQSQQEPRIDVSSQIPLPVAESPPRIPTLEQSQFVHCFNERLTSKSGVRFRFLPDALVTKDFNVSLDRLENRNYGVMESTDMHESVHEVSSDSKTLQTSYSEEKLFTPHNKLAKQRNLKQQTVEVNYCNCGPVPKMLTSGFCTCSGVSSKSYDADSKPDTSLEINGDNLSVASDASSDSIESDNKSKNDPSAVSLEESQSERNEMVGQNLTAKDSLQQEIQTMEDVTDQHLIGSDDESSIVRSVDMGTATADQLDTCRELEKCRELLRVQYNLTSMYKKEVASLAQKLSQSEDEKAKKVDEMSKLSQMHIAHINKLQEHTDKSGLDQGSSHITIREGEGLFEIHSQSMHLSPEGLAYLTEEKCECDSENVKHDAPSLFLTWLFFKEDIAYTPVEKAATDIDFDSSFVHRVTINNEFLEYLAKDYCIIEVHKTVGDASETVARGTISFSELLKFPQNKIHGTVSLSGMKNKEASIDFGIIQCWFRLSCSVQLISHYLQQADVRTENLKPRNKVPVPAPRQINKCPPCIQSCADEQRRGKTSTEELMDNKRNCFGMSAIQDSVAVMKMASVAEAEDEKNEKSEGEQEISASENEEKLEYKHVNPEEASMNNNTDEKTANEALSKEESAELHDDEKSNIEDAEEELKEEALSNSKSNSIDSQKENSKEEEEAEKEVDIRNEDSYRERGGEHDGNEDILEEDEEKHGDENKEDEDEEKQDEVKNKEAEDENI
ncbi:protein fantom-like [Periplaneta americana]|uniref:protein fantom-like n=1 Tax=Periplaneta americana TaxID=6978 RepID=UPI0037E7912F